MPNEDTTCTIPDLELPVSPPRDPPALQPTSAAERRAVQSAQRHGRFAGYTKERRREILAHVDQRLQAGQSVWRIARELGVGKMTLRRWLARRENRTPQVLTEGPLHSRARLTAYAPRKTCRDRAREP